MCCSFWLPFTVCDDRFGVRLVAVLRMIYPDTSQVAILALYVPLDLLHYVKDRSTVSVETIVRTHSPPDPGPAREAGASTIWKMIVNHSRKCIVEHGFGHSPDEIIRQVISKDVEDSLESVQSVGFFRQVSSCESLGVVTVFVKRRCLCTRLVKVLSMNQSLVLTYVNV